MQGHFGKECWTGTLVGRQAAFDGLCRTDWQSVRERTDGLPIRPTCQMKIDGPLLTGVFGVPMALPTKKGSAVFEPSGPLPATHSPTETIFYDGHCGLCHWAVRFVLAKDRNGDAFRFAPLDSDAFRAAVPQEQRTG